MTNKEMINRIKDIADCADAAYVKLDYVFENIDAFFDSDKWNEADDIRLGNQTKENDRYLNGREILPSSNTAYARCIEARFMQDVVIEKGVFKDTTINNDPKNVLLDSIISHRTKNFVNYYELIHHIPNTLSGFSATIFRDLRESNTTTNTKEFKKHFEYIIAFRGTEVDTKGILSDVLGADVSLATAGMAITQANALEPLSKAIFRAIINHHTLSSKKENSYVYDKNLESIQDSYQSYKSIKEYFSSNNIKVAITGHLGDTKTLDSIKVA